jgi:hypothetical protein
MLNDPLSSKDQGTMPCDTPSEPAPCAPLVPTAGLLLLLLI